MIRKSPFQSHYSSAKKRFLQASIENFLDREFPRTFGPIIRQKISEKIVELVEQQLPEKDFLRPGQCVWNAISISSRPDSPNRQMVPVILTLVEPADVELLAQGTLMSGIARQSVARMCKEAFEQGALMSMRDIGLLVGRSITDVSKMRKKWEADKDTILPHVGTIHDFGTCITHKTAIVRKVIYEAKDPRKVADETKHSQRAVDRYLKDFHRVKTCYQVNPDIEFVSRTTGMSNYLVEQYIRIINEHEKTTSSPP